MATLKNRANGPGCTSLEFEHKISNVKLCCVCVNKYSISHLRQSHRVNFFFSFQRVLLVKFRMDRSGWGVKGP